MTNESNTEQRPSSESPKPQGWYTDPATMAKMIRNGIADAFTNMPDLVVYVDDINRAQKGVRVSKQRARI